jgi:TldD protein
MGGATVETALGPVDTTALGPTLMHEHIVTRSPGVHENWPHLFDRDAILSIADRKMADLHDRGIRTIVDLTTVKSRLEYPVEKPFDTMSVADKAALLGNMDVAARAYSPHIVQVTAGYLELRRRMWLFNSDGVQVEDDRTFTEMRGGVVAGKNGTLQRVNEGFGGRIGLELLDRNDALAKIRGMAEGAVRMLDAKPCPAGDMTVVMCNGWGGVLFHEACGHQMEADFITKGSSAYTGKIGEQVANPIITAIEDGTIPGRRGSLKFDDDGTAAQCTVLIEKGILKEYMWDKVECRRVGRATSTGNGRRL